MTQIVIIPLRSLPLIKGGDSLSDLIVTAACHEAVGVQQADIVVVAQKIVSKAEGAVKCLKDVTPSDYAKQIAHQTGRDPRFCQLIIDESQEIISLNGRVIVTKHHNGLVLSSAGIDRSNVAPASEELVTLLPRDPDASCGVLRNEILCKTGKNVAVIINDSLGRPDRGGSVGTAIGQSGLRTVEEDGGTDLFGNASSAQIALVDELAAAGSLLMRQGGQRIPVVLIRGVDFMPCNSGTLRSLLH